MKKQYLGLLTSAASTLLLVPTAAFAQLGSPVQQGNSQSTTGMPTPNFAVPQTVIPTYQPPVLEAPAQPVEATAQAAATKLAPTTPSEFEAHVSQIAGKPLRRFGSELLIPEARDFQAPPTAQVPAEYRLQSGDVIRLGLSGGIQANAINLTVDNNGRVFVPRVGAVRVAGVRVADLHDVLSQAISRQYRNFDLDVTIARLRGVTVYVTGFANRPGAYSVGGLSTLVNAVLAAGGPSSGGSFRSIQLRRSGQVVSDFDLYDLLLRGDTRGDAVLQNGDVLYIAPAGDQVAVLGSVNREGIFEVAPGESLRDAVVYAGGTNTVADTDRLLVFDTLGRTVGWQQLTAAEASSRTARRGDIVRVVSDVGIARPIGLQPVLVTLSGEVARPGHYYVQPGTRLADVITQAGGLTVDAFPYASVITRESVKAQQRESFTRAVNDMELLLSTQPLVSVDRARMAQPANIALIDSVVEKMRSREPSGRLVFGMPVTATTLPADLVVENNDVVHVPTRPVTVGVFGAVPSPASFSYREGATIGNFVNTAGGIQRLGAPKDMFVVRANGTVIADGRRTLKAPALPGDLIFVPIEANRGEFWTRLRDISSSLFGGLVGVASVRTLIK